MERVFANLGRESGFHVDIKHEVRLKLVLNAVADNDPMLLHVRRLKWAHHSLTIFKRQKRKKQDEIQLCTMSVLSLKSSNTGKHRSTGKQRACRASSSLFTCSASGKQRACRASSSLFTCNASGKQRAWCTADHFTALCFAWPMNPWRLYNVTIARSPSSYSLKITDRSFRYAYLVSAISSLYLFVNLILAPVPPIPTHLFLHHHFFLF